MKGGDLSVSDKELTDGKSEESLLSVHWLEAEAELVRFGGCLGEPAEPTEGSSEAVLGSCTRTGCWTTSGLVYMFEDLHPRVGLNLFLPRPSRWLTSRSEIHSGWSRAVGASSLPFKVSWRVIHTNSYRWPRNRRTHWIFRKRNFLQASLGRLEMIAWMHSRLYEDMVKNFPWTNLRIKCFERRYKLTLLFARDRES